MRNSVMLLAFGVVTSACGGADSSIPTGTSRGPSPSLARGTLVVSTSTRGIVPNQDGYLLVLDSTPFVLPWNGTARLAAPTGYHALRLRRVPQNCSVIPDTAFVVVVPRDDTIAVDFFTTCPPVRGYARVTLVTMGSPSTPAPYDVWYEHYQASGDGDAGPAKLGELSPGGVLLVYLPVSTDSGEDPYWYQFWIYPVPSNCGADTTTSQYHITARDTVDVALTVACTG